jgi:hypothetical protein
MRVLQQSIRITVVGLLLAGFAACSDDVRDAEVELQLSYEAIPGVGVVLPQGTVDTSGSDFADKLEFTQDVFATLVPDVMAAVDVEFADVDSEITPGGFLLETSPSMQTRLVASDFADVDATADRLAAALGYTMYQFSVLVTDFTAVEGATGYAVVRFPEGALTPDLAQAFFAHAATVDGGLGGGYTAFDDDMIFLNVRDDAGEPFSGLDDAAFFAGLEQAADSFADAEAAFLESGFADARFVGNDWEVAPDGSEYLATLGAGAQEALDPLQAAFAQIVDDAAATYGWIITPQALGAKIGPVTGIRRGHWRELTILGDLPAR